MSAQLERITQQIDGAYVEPALRLVSLEEFVTRPNIRWLIRDLLTPQAIMVVFGPPKGGKTFSVCDLMMHAAHGLDWHGHKIPRPLRVAFLAGEGRMGLKVRLHAWLMHHDTAQRSGDFQLLPEALSLPERVLEVIDMLRLYAPDIVVVDTLNAYFGGGDENSTQDMTQFVTALRMVRDAVGCAVVTLHHTGLADSGRERGSGVLRGAADVIVQVAKDEGDTGLVGFQVVTGRDVPGWDSALALRLRKVETDWLEEPGDAEDSENPQPMATCVVEAADSPVTLPGRGRKLNDKQRITVEIVQKLARERANGSSTVLLHRHEIVDEAVKSGINRTVAYRHLDQLAGRMHWRLLEPGSLEVRL